MKQIEVNIARSHRLPTTHGTTNERIMQQTTSGISWGHTLAMSCPIARQTTRRYFEWLTETIETKWFGWIVRAGHKKNLSTTIANYRSSRWIVHTTKRYSTDRWTRLRFTSHNRIGSIAYFQINLSNRKGRRTRIVFSIIDDGDFIIRITSPVVETNNHRTRCFSLHVSHLHEYSYRWSPSLSSSVL